MSRLLDHINQPEDLKSLTIEQLQQLATEIREELIGTVHRTGGHLASNLGVVELTLALHSVFDSPQDKMVWDVGHQTYVHKLLTGRRENFGTLRQYQGLSGFPAPEESPHDALGAGHASTSVSAALGLAVARDLLGEDGHVIAVIGDGAMTGGLAFEGLNNAGHLGARLIVILNDNGMSISRNVGAIARYLNRIRTAPRYHQAKAGVENFLARVPLGAWATRLLKRVKNGVKGLVIPTMIWEELGFTYVGPIDGHDFSQLLETLRSAKSLKRPTLVHVYTVKGRGYAPAEKDATSFHGISPSSNNGGGKETAITYTKVFANTAIKMAQADPRVVAITAAMPDGTGLVSFAKEFPNRFFDVGIAEGHALTFAGALAAQGLRPIVAVYSTFMQRAFDQIVHDVCTQNLPVIMALDRAGIVGDDGRTHQGAFDLAYLRLVPNMVVMAPKDENELQEMLWTALDLNRPVAIRYPRGAGVGVPMENGRTALPFGKAEVLLEGRNLAILAIGAAVYPALEAARMLESRGVSACVVNARFAKPLDASLLLHIARRFSRIVTVEEGTLHGGFGSAVTELLQDRGVTETRVVRLGLPDEFVEHGTQALLRDLYGLSPRGIAQAVFANFPELEYLPLGVATRRE